MKTKHNQLKLKQAVLTLEEGLHRLRFLVHPDQTEGFRALRLLRKWARSALEVQAHTQLNRAVNAEAKLAALRKKERSGKEKP
ncbi:MAG TPA: hypothetical protein VFU31_20935 [Candidatus Binatia bacterium]|nr:hypothetical protein [Candidatus Binatia bacterium]